MNKNSKTALLLALQWISMEPEPWKCDSELKICQYTCTIPVSVTLGHDGGLQCYGMGSVSCRCHPTPVSWPGVCLAFLRNMHFIIISFPQQRYSL